MTPFFETLLEDEMRSSYIDYAMSVIVGRALPDVRDGLKPVQRRILYAMRELGLLPNKPYRKSATVVGEVIGKYHPHGDSAVYDALVRMAQDFSLRYPLIQGQGNFGSIYGDPPAAYRYTEARLSKIALELLQDIDEDTVDFVPNFDGRLKEPVVLPSKIPNLIVNGSSGIAVGLATNVPPHNLGEVVDALVALIDNPSISIEDLMQYIPGPDFPTGAIIVGREGIRDAYLTGRGRIVVRAKVHFEEEKNRTRIVITEVPYQVSTNTIIEKIAQLVRNKKIQGIQDLRDETDRRGIRIVIEVKRGYDPNIVLNNLYLHTPLQTTFGAIMIALVDGEPKTLNLKELLQHYILHREEVITRRTKFRLDKAEKRAHILEGFKKALSYIDEIIETIKKSDNQQEAKIALMERFQFSDAQAQAILDMKLGNLTKLDRDKIDKEYEELIKEIARLKSILENKQLLYEEIKKELLEIKEKYADKRRTVIEDGEVGSLDVEDLIPREDVVITLTHLGYVKRTPVKNYRSQNRGGVGRSGVYTYEDDYPIGVFTCNTHDVLMAISNKGRAFTFKAYELPEASMKAKGRSIKALLKLKEDEKIIFMVPVESFHKEYYVVFMSRHGYIKKTHISAYENARKNGIIAIKLRDDDEIVDVTITNGERELVVAKSSGYAVRFSESDVRPTARDTQGVKGIALSSGEWVVSMAVNKPGRVLLAVTEHGYGKRLDPEDIRKTKRGAKGVRIIKITHKTGKLVRLRAIGDDDHVILLTKSGTVIRLKAEEIKKLGRNAMGVRLMKVKEDDEIIDVDIIEEKDYVKEGEMF